MIEILQPGFRTGAVHIPASKSQAHRLLICAALSQNETVIRCRGISRDIAATADCLNALGAEIWLRGEDLTVRPITQKPQGTRHLQMCIRDSLHTGAAALPPDRPVRSQK